MQKGRIVRVTAPNGELLEVSFHYRTFDEEDLATYREGTFQDGKLHLDSHKRVRTTCVISVVDPDPDPDKTAADRFTKVVSADTVYNPHDTFDKRLGRRKAMTRALQGLPESFDIPKSRRAEIFWKPYFEQHPDKKGVHLSGW